MGKRKKRADTAEQRAEAVKIALGSDKPITLAAMFCADSAPLDVSTNHRGKR